MAIFRRRQGDGFAVPICRQAQPFATMPPTATGSERSRVRQPSRRGNRGDSLPQPFAVIRFGQSPRRSDSLPTGSRQTRHNRPPCRSRRSDGFAPVPIRRRALCRSCTPWRSADGRNRRRFGRSDLPTGRQVRTGAGSGRSDLPTATGRRVRTVTGSDGATVRRGVCVHGKIKPRQGLSNLINRNAALFRGRSRRQATARRGVCVQGKSNPVKVYQTSSN